MFSRVGRSKTGLPTVTENGGGSTSTGSAVVICGAHGEKLKPLFVPRGYSNGEHAIFVAKPGMLILNANHSRRGESVTVHRIMSVGNQDDPDALITEIVFEYENGDGNIPDFLTEAAEATIKKSYCYHCREPHYVA